MANVTKKDIMEMPAEELKGLILRLTERLEGISGAERGQLTVLRAMAQDRIQQVARSAPTMSRDEAWAMAGHDLWRPSDG